LLDPLFDGKFVCHPQVRPMFKSRFQIAGEALPIAALSASAAAQNPHAPINTLTDLEAALMACWGSAADGAVASRHADHGADELQAQRRAIRTAKDHFSIEGSVSFSDCNGSWHGRNHHNFN